MSKDLVGDAVQKAAALAQGGRAGDAARLLERVARRLRRGDARLVDAAVRVELRRGDGEKALSRHEALCARWPEVAKEPLALQSGAAAAYYAGRHDEAARRYRLAVGAARERGQTGEEASALLGLAVSEGALGHASRAVNVAREARALAKERGLGSLEGAILHNLADFARGAARYGEALTLAREAAALFGATASPRWRLRARVNLAELCAVTGAGDEALQLAGDALVEAQARGDAILSVLAACIPVRVHLEYGRLAEARRTLQQAERMGRHTTGLGAMALEVHAAWVAVAARDPGARALAEAASRDPLRPRSRPLAAWLAAEAALAEGAEPDEAAASLRRAAHEADQQGDAEAGWRCHLSLALLHEARAGDPEIGEEEARSAVHHAAAARALIERGAASLPDEAARRRYLETPSRRDGLARARRLLALAAAESRSAREPLPPTGLRAVVSLVTEMPVARSREELQAVLLDSFLDVTGAARVLLWLPGDPDHEGALVKGRAVGVGDIAVPHPGAISPPIAAALADEIWAAHALPRKEGEGFLCGGSALCIPVPWVKGERGFIYADHPREPGLFPPARAETFRVFVALGAMSLVNINLLERLRGDRDRMAEQQARIEELTGRLEETLARREAVLADALTRLDDRGESPRSRLVGTSAAMVRLFALLDRLRGSDVAVLVTGESGTGKEVVARTIHAESPRAQGPFVAVNCAALPEGVLESELFGHVKGAFTGAESARPGLIVAADGGTLFMDEVGDMPPAMQAKLLRVLQDGEVRAVGAERARRVDVRFLAATHRDLEEAVKAGRFRADLYYRLNVVRVQVPPLRERVEDLPLLVAHLVSRQRRGRPLALSPGALELLARYGWPGNVRELMAAVETAALFASGAVLTADDFLRKPELARFARGGGGGQAPRVSAPEVLHLGELSAWALREALARHGGNRAMAARALGIGRATLYRRLKELGL